MHKRHPELQAYTPSDRYGPTATSSRRNVSSPRKALPASKIPCVTPSQTNPRRQPPSETIRASKKISQTGETASLSRETRSQTRLGDGSKPKVSEPPKPNSGFHSSREEKTCSASSKILKTSIASRHKSRSSPKSSGVCELARPKSAMSHQREAPSKCPNPLEDSGVEAEFSLTEISSSSSSSSRSSPPSSSSTGSEVIVLASLPNSLDSNEQRIQEAREHFDALAKKEETDRQSRLQLVENILTRLNITQEAA